MSPGTTENPPLSLTYLWWYFCCTFKNLFSKFRKWRFPVNNTMWTPFPAPLQRLHKWKEKEQKTFFSIADHMQVIYLRSHSELFAREGWFSLLPIWLKLSLNMFGNLQVAQENIWECLLFLKYLFWLITERERTFFIHLLGISCPQNSELNSFFQP